MGYIGKKELGSDIQLNEYRGKVLRVEFECKDTRCDENVHVKYWLFQQAEFER